MRRRVLYCLLACCMLLAPTGCAKGERPTELTVLKVGKADAIIIATKGYTILMDAGEEEDAAEILKYLDKAGIRSIDVMVITHYDKDHVGGADGVLRGIPVLAVYDADYESDSREYYEYLYAIEQTAAPRTRVKEATALTLGSLTLTLMPTAIKEGDDNDNSLCASLRDPWHSVFFAADATEARIDELLREGLGEHDVLKMPHHGRYEKNLDDLVTAINPRLAIITDSDKNPAAKKTLELLSAREIYTCSTRDGNIHVYSEKQGLSVEQKQ